MARRPPGAVSTAGPFNPSAARGCSRRSHNGERRAITNDTNSTAAPISSVGRSPTVSPNTPPSSAPIGATPKTSTRRLALTRPSRWSGVSACRTLIWLMLYIVIPPPIKR